jgi:hypothetical protein
MFERINTATSCKLHAASKYKYRSRKMPSAFAFMLAACGLWLAAFISA